MLMVCSSTAIFFPQSHATGPIFLISLMMGRTLKRGLSFLLVLLVRVLHSKVCLEDLESLLRIGTTNIGIHKRIEIGHVIPLKLLVKTRGGAEAIQDIEAKELSYLFDTEGAS
jgi:hypothetical protein